MDANPAKLSWGDLFFWLAILGLAIAFLVLEQRRSVGSEDAYRATISRYRSDKDRFFREDSTSPYRNKGTFPGLAYYPIRSEWRFELSLWPVPDTGALWLPTTAGTQVAFRAAGWVQLPKPGGGVAPLLVLRTVGKDERLFILFSDETSEDETFEQGRCVDVQRLIGRHVFIDLNQAYHPPCAYRTDAACPLPPEVNHLDFAVPVGERLPEPQP